MNILEFFTKCATNEFRTNTTKSGTYTIQQTERNQLKAQSIEVFKDLLKDSLEKQNLESNDISANVDLTKEGIVLSIYNEKLDQEICFIFNPVIPALTYDSQAEAQAYQIELEEKQAKQEEKARLKAQKQARDKALREKAKAERQAREN